MRTILNLVYLIGSVFASFIEYAHLPAHSTAYTYIWAVASFLYPFCIALARPKPRFWNGLVILMLIFALAHLFEGVVILTRGSGVQGLLHPDSETVALFGFRIIEPLGDSIIWYPFGFLAFWLLGRQFPKVFKRGILVTNGR
jgi:hypothetical protein